ncbi:MAG TPA: DUF1707 domain-containing protein [Streptosporangiaceae bacterium]|jgi:transposase
MAARPDLRIGTAEREARAAELREHYAHGRLSLAEFNERLNAVFASVTQEQLDRVTADLPHVRVPSAALATAGSTIPPGGAGPGSQSGRRGARGALSMIGAFAAMLVVVMAAWLIVHPLGSMHFWAIPWAGRAGVLLAALAVVRGLIRRIFRLARHGR